LKVFIGFTKDDKWKLYFDGLKCVHGARVGIFLINPHGDVIALSYHLSFDCTNNMEKYEALILHLKDAILLKVKKIKIFGDSQLIIKQVSNIYNAKDQKIQPYKEMVKNLLMYFSEYYIENIQRDNNRYVDAMASAASLAPINIEHEQTILNIKNIDKPSH